MTDFSPVFVWAELYLYDLDHKINDNVCLEALRKFVSEARKQENAITR